MKDLLMMLSSVMPEEMIIDELKKAIAEYEADPSKENRSKISMHASLLLSKECCEAEPEGVVGMMKRADRVSQAMDLLNPKKN